MAHAKQVFDSLDLIRHIYSFGDPIHREQITQIKADLIPRPDLFAMAYQQRSHQMLYDYTLQQYLVEYSDREIEQYIQEYSRCFCCSRHSINRPRWIYRPSPPQFVFENKDSKCECCCRSLTRALVRHLEDRGYDT